MATNPFAKYAQPAAPGGPIIAPADPFKAASEARAQEDQEIERQRLDLAVEQAARAEAAAIRAAQEKPPVGYRYSADGNLEPIPGGPAERGRDGNSIPQTAFDRTNVEMKQYTALANAADTFQDDFGGNWAGGLENTAQAYSPIPVGTPGQSEWWAGFKGVDNQIRNDLFGAALTATEKAAYSATTIEPGMNPAKIRENLARRTEIIQNALQRRREFYLANGYRPEAVDAMFADLLNRQRLNEADQQEGSDEERAAPPRFQIGDGNIPGGTLNNGDDRGGPTIAQGETIREDNPVLAGVRDEYARRLESGQSAQEIISWARQAGIDPSAFPSIAAQVRFRRENPNVAINQYDTTQLDDRTVNLSRGEQMLNSVAQSPVGSFLIGAGDAASAFTLDEIIGATGGNAERARLGMGQVAEQNPISSLAGNIAGGTMMALGGEAALGSRAAASVLPRSITASGIPRAIAADSAYGAAAGAGASAEGERVQGALLGGAFGAAGSYAGQRAGNALGGIARGVNDPAVRTLRNEGVNALTLGQTVGNSGGVGAAVKGIEDRLSGVPIVGEMVNGRRREGVRQFNSAAFNRALEPIGGSVNGRTGAEAIDEAQQQVSAAFTAALAGKGAVPDATFQRDLISAVNGVRSIKRLGDEVTDEIGDIMRPYANEPILSGEALDDISRSLRDIKVAYRNDPLGNRIGRQIDRVERAVFDMFDRQASGTIQGYQEARQAYRRISTLEDAVLKANNQKDNLFTPAQLGQADVSNTRRYGGKRAAARGDTPFNDLQQAGQRVLPNQVPDSGTAGRLLVPLVLAGGSTGAGAAAGDTTTGLTIGAILAAAFSRGGQRLLTKPVRGINNPTIRGALESDRTRRAIGAVGGASAAGAVPAVAGILPQQ